MNELWPSLTIHPISYERVEETFSEEDGKFYQTLNEDDRPGHLVERIIALYNAKRPESSPPFRRDAVKTEGDFWKPEEHRGFNIISYLRCGKKSASAMDQFCVERGGEEVSEIEWRTRVFFLVRQRSEEERRFNDIFGMATDNGWKIFSRFRDLAFTREVGGYLLAWDVTRLRKRPLVSAKLSKEVTIERGHKISPALVALSIVQQVTSAIRKGVEFPDEIKESVKSRELTLLEGGLRLHSKLSPAHLAILAAFYVDSNEKALKDELHEGKKEVRDLFNLVQPVIGISKDPLLRSLARPIFNALREGSPYRVSLRFSPPHHINDYIATDKCTITIGKEKQPWNYHASSAEVIKYLSEIKEIRKASQFEEFFNLIKKGKFTFRCKGEDVTQKLLSCFEGEVVVLDPKPARHFFHLDGKWYTSSSDWIARCHEIFQDFLDKALIRPGELGYLRKPWPKRDSKSKRDDIEARYNLSFINEKDFVVGDTACPNGVELFDLLFLMSEQAFVYQVKANFSGSTRDAASQIINAANLFHEFLVSSKSDLMTLWGEELKRKQPDVYKRLGEEGIKNITLRLKKLERNKIIFVFAFALEKTKRGNDREIERELSIVKWLDDNALNNLAASLSPPVTGLDLKNALIESEMIDKEGRVQSQLVHVTLKGEVGAEEMFNRKFVLQEWNPDQKRQLYLKLKEEVGSHFKSFIPRISLLQVQSKLNKLGFSFRICQIPSTEPTGGTDDIPIEQRLADEPSETLLAVGSRFTFNGKMFEVVETDDEGVSPLHALLGKEDKGTMKWKPRANKMPRDAFLEQLKSLKNDKVKTEIEEHLLSAWIKPHVLYSASAQALKEMLPRPEVNRYITSRRKSRANQHQSLLEELKKKVNLWDTYMLLIKNPDYAYKGTELALAAEIFHETVFILMPEGTNKVQEIAKLGFTENKKVVLFLPTSADRGRFYACKMIVPSLN